MTQPNSPSGSRRSMDGSRNPDPATSNGARSAPLLQSSPSTSTLKPRMLDKLRPWKTTVAGRRKSGFFSSSGSSKKDGDLVAGDPYVHAAVAAHNPPNPRPDATSDDERDDDAENGYEWEEDSDGASDRADPTVYSWVDPSLIGTSVFRASPAGSSRDVTSPNGVASMLDAPLSPIALPDPPPVSMSSSAPCSDAFGAASSR